MAKALRPSSQVSIGARNALQESVQTPISQCLARRFSVICHARASGSVTLDSIADTRHAENLNSGILP